MTTHLSESQVLEALGDETRRSIVDLLHSRPHGVRELADQLPVSRSAVSQHLRVLKLAGLVADEARGTRRVYSMHPAGFDVLRTYLDRMWTAGLAAFAAAAEEQALAAEQADTTKTNNEQESQ